MLGKFLSIEGQILQRNKQTQVFTVQRQSARQCVNLCERLRGVSGPVCVCVCAVVCKCGPKISKVHSSNRKIRDSSKRLNCMYTVAYKMILKKKQNSTT